MGRIHSEMGFYECKMGLSKKLVFNSIESCKTRGQKKKTGSRMT